MSLLKKMLYLYLLSLECTGAKRFDVFSRVAFLLTLSQSREKAEPRKQNKQQSHTSFHGLVIN